MQIDKARAWALIDNWHGLMTEAVETKQAHYVALYSEAVATLSALLIGGDDVLELDPDDMATVTKAAEHAPLN